MRDSFTDVRTDCDVAALRRDILDKLFYIQGRFPAVATPNDWYLAVSYAVRDRLLKRWICTSEHYREREARTVAYFSAEYLPGPHLGLNLVNLGIMEQTRAAVQGLGLEFDRILAQEEEPGLGNGGLGRLASCFMESLTSLEIPAIGYGIRYEFGIFDQEIQDGWQHELTDRWLRLGNPWEIQRPEVGCEVGFGGRTEAYTDAQGRHRVRWVPARIMQGIAYDTVLPGYRVNTANFMRLWKAEAPTAFDFASFNRGDYWGAVGEHVSAGTLTKVLYPNDAPPQGKELRLQQQHFFVSCSLQDMIRICLQRTRGISELHRKYAVQLNDTHPALAVVELMRLLVDVHGMDWEPAWEIAREIFGYTNHTILPEALERWPLPLFARLLPRHLELVYEINRRFLDDVRRIRPGDEALAARVSLIDDAGEREVRMAHLACVGSHAVNGVSALHSALLTREVLRDFHALMPEKFGSVTNGVTPRRFLLLANPRLARLVTAAIGEGWVRDLEALSALEPLAEDVGFRAAWRAARLENKRDLAAVLLERAGVCIDPEALLDVQAKRIHEYKRQHLNVLHIVALYRRLKDEPGADLPPRTFLFAGKAAPGYAMAKLIIKLVHAVAETVNADPTLRRRLRVVFLPDYNVKNGERLFGAADLSEQISTAGKEASGTGNMKFALNGALTVGTMDGANVEILEHVGPEGLFAFGLSADEAISARVRGYDPGAVARGDEELRAVLELVASGAFSRGDRELFRPLVDSLLSRDEYLVLADFRAYVECQARLGRFWQDAEAWTRASIRTTSRMGWFSSDRAIREYCAKIWRVTPEPVTLTLPTAAEKPCHGAERSESSRASPSP